MSTKLMEHPEIPGNFIEAMYEGLDLERISQLEKEAVGDEFARMVEDRQYREARKFFQNLPDEQRKYILNEPKYRTTMKALRISSL